MGSGDGGIAVYDYLSSAYAVLVGLALYLAASLVAAPIRRVLTREHADLPALSAHLRHLLVAMLRPGIVLVLTEALLPLARYRSGAAAWVMSHPGPVTAWRLFWTGALLLLLAEAITRRIYAARKRDFPIPDLLLGIIRALLMVSVAFAVLRSEMGLNLAPLLASTALLTAVVGFALQGVLGNLLAGMSLHIVKTVVPGDWAIIGDTEGQVTQTNWRETRLRSRDGHVLIVPNSKVAESLVNNMTRPDKQRRHAIHVGASYSDAPDDVIAALLESASSVPEVLPNPAPEAFIVEYQDYGINYRLRFWTNDYFHRDDVNAVVNRMIWYKFKRRGIEIPFPMSDQLLNDFMAVVYNQRRMQPEPTEVDARTRDILESDFCRKLCIDETGKPLLSEGEVGRISLAVRRVRYTRGETLFRQGDEGETFFVVVKGRLRGRIDPEGGAPVVEFDLGKGTLVGEMSLMTGLPRTATLTVTESAELLEFDRNAFALVLGAHENVPIMLSRLVAERAAENEANLERLRKTRADAVGDDLKQPGILRRFLSMIGRS